MNISRRKRAFEVKYKTFFLVSEVLPFRIKKHNSKDILDITFAPTCLTTDTLPLKRKGSSHVCKVGLSPFKKFVFIDFNESPLKMMKNAFCFMFKALLIPQIFTLLSWLFGHVEKQLDKKAMVNFKIYDITDQTKFNYNTYTAQYLKKKRQPDNENWSVTRI